MVRESRNQQIVEGDKWLGGIPLHEWKLYMDRNLRADAREWINTNAPGQMRPGLLDKYKEVDSSNLDWMDELFKDLFPHFERKERNMHMFNTLMHLRQRTLDDLGLIGENNPPTCVKICFFNEALERVQRR